jgi:uncharacterized protein (TIGR03118 family)
MALNKPKYNDKPSKFDRGDILNRVKGQLTGNTYAQTNLVANKPEYDPLILDPTFVNAWGVAIRPAGLGGHFWVTAAGSGISYEYVGDVNGTPLFQDDLKEVTVPGPNGTQGSPTGVVFNGSKNFVITQEFPTGAITAPTKFLFATDSGVISAWTERKRADGGFDWPGAAIPVIDRSATGSQYFGIGVDQAGNHLYAADFGKNPKIQVFDGQFQDVTSGHGFQNPFDGGDGVQPGEYAPFNVQSLVDRNGKETIFVTYAQTREDPDNPGELFAGEENAGAGLGRLVAFDSEGSQIRIWNDGGLLNAPWGVAYAPSNFGAFANTLLVSNFGDGTITAFDPNTFTAIDLLRDGVGNPVQIGGIWGLQFGNGASLGDTDSLYFAAGPEEEEDGLFGRLRLDRTLLPADAPIKEFIQAATELLAEPTGGSGHGKPKKNGDVESRDRKERHHHRNNQFSDSHPKDVNVLIAEAGDDTLFGKRGDNVFIAEAGDITAYGGAKRDLFSFSDGNHTMYGNRGTNLFLTGKGNDVAYGGKDDDFFSLGDGNNIAYSNGGNDIFMTGSGDDIIYAGSDKNYIYAGAGNDLIYGGRGTNVISAGIGDDRIYLGSGSSKLILDKGAGSVNIWNFKEIDAISLGSSANKTDVITTSISGLNTEIYAGGDLLATLMNTTANNIQIG